MLQIRVILLWNHDVYFDVLPTVHLSISILIIDQSDAQNLFYSFWRPDDEHMVLETCRGMK